MLCAVATWQCLLADGCRASSYVSWWCSVDGSTTRCMFQSFIFLLF